MWQHLYVVDTDGIEQDVMNNGELSCAYMVSSVLTIFQLIDMPHATVRTTLERMHQTGWYQIDAPVEGAVVVWDEHIGFYVADEWVISNSSSIGITKRHSLKLEDGREPIGFYIHPQLMTQSAKSGKSEAFEVPSIELGQYEHYKGQQYEVLGVALQSENLEPLVIYKPLYESDVPFWARPYALFTDMISIEGQSIPRFKKRD